MQRRTRCGGIGPAFGGWRIPPRLLLALGQPRAAAASSGTPESTSAASTSANAPFESAWPATRFATCRALHQRARARGVSRSTTFTRSSLSLSASSGLPARRSTARTSRASARALSRPATRATPLILRRRHPAQDAQLGPADCPRRTLHPAKAAHRARNPPLPDRSALAPRSPLARPHNPRAARPSRSQPLTATILPATRASARRSAAGARTRATRRASSRAARAQSPRDAPRAAARHRARDLPDLAFGARTRS